MKVRLLVSRSGETGAFAPGDVIDVPDNEVPHMLAGGQCEVVREKSVERAVSRAKPETAAD